MDQKIEIRNRRASFEYELLERYIAGIVLTGTEIKSVREAKVSLPEAYCLFLSNELFVREMHIAEYKWGSIYNHEPKRDRKLLLNRKELNKLKRKSQEKGLTIIPTFLFINERGIAKIEIALAKGKKLYDKRESIKNRDLDRSMRNGE